MPVCIKGKKSKFLFFLILICFYTNCFAQKNVRKRTFSKLNNINVEFCGPALGYSVNYDRMFKLHDYLKTSISIGYEYYLEHYAVFQYNLLFGNKHNFELGLGYLYCLTNSKLEYYKVLTGRIGYRYQNISNPGFVFRVGLTPVLNYGLDYNPPGGYMGGITIGRNF